MCFSSVSFTPAKTGHYLDGGLILDQHRRRWPSIRPSLSQFRMLYVVRVYCEQDIACFFMESRHTENLCPLVRMFMYFVWTQTWFQVMISYVSIVRGKTPRGAGGALPYCYWGCAAGQGAFLSFQLWHRVSFLSFWNWDRVLFWASNSGHPLSMYFGNFSGHYQPNFITFVSIIAAKCYKQILKSLKRPWNITCIGSNYTISWWNKFGVFFSKSGHGVFLAARRIGTGSVLEHAGGTPLPISKASG